jgi:hypothetical protein
MSRQREIQDRNDALTGTSLNFLSEEQNRNLQTRKVKTKTKTDKKYQENLVK